MTDIRDVALMAGVTEISSQDVPCFDPECDGVGEPEQDGDHAYYTCDTCGSDFGYERIGQMAVDSDGGSCAIGVPEDLRRLASSGMENALEGSTSVPVTLRKKSQ